MCICNHAAVAVPRPQGKGREGKTRAFTLRATQPDRHTQCTTWSRRQMLCTHRPGVVCATQPAAVQSSIYATASYSITIACLHNRSPPLAKLDVERAASINSNQSLPPTKMRVLSQKCMYAESGGSAAAPACPYQHTCHWHCHWQLCLTTVTHGSDHFAQRAYAVLGSHQRRYRWQAAASCNQTGTTRNGAVQCCSPAHAPNPG